MAVSKTMKEALEGVEGMGPGKVFPMEGLKNAAAPFAFYIQGSEEVEETLDGPTELCRCSFEVHIVGRSYSELMLLGARSATALRALQGKERNGVLLEHVQVRQTSPDLKEKEVNLYRRDYAVTIKYQEV